MPASAADRAPAPLPVADLPAFLLGRWRLERTIEDRRRDERGEVSGTAEFVRDGDAIAWRERATVRLGGYAGDATRTLAIVPDGDAWLVRFDDGRPFHPLDLRSGACVVDHPCRADRYGGRLWVPDGDALAVDWRVTGPEKDQRIRSRYRRQPPVAPTDPAAR
ncbi:DUF6314 family protein [Patulibacter defluvii]|uniref:DUF6314 family protein n=1 Tax=Patulibacter defluvii TaxID=3095358 RepID=UPI002A75D108|nr:DUF6314 family protein [Patulibacter sp. DM4]